MGPTCEAAGWSLALLGLLPSHLGGTLVASSDLPDPSQFGILTHPQVGILPFRSSQVMGSGSFMMRIHWVNGLGQFELPALVSESEHE